MLRPTKQQIDDEIIDCAAMLFARHGFKETSVQRIADAVGYSKTGLLHRYPSKEALQAAVIDRCVSEIRAVADGVCDMTPGPERDRSAVAALVRCVLHRPGFVALMLASLISPPDSEMSAILRPVGGAVLDAFVFNPDTDDLARTVRVAGALGAVAVARIAIPEHLSADLTGHLIDLGYDALGHRDPAAT